MNRTSDVSVVIPIFNGELYAAKAIESVLSQSRPPAQIIVVDDGSWDETPEILEQYRGRIETTWTKNSGVSNARNVGIALARCRYIAFLDHDDIWLKKKLEKQIEALDKFPEIGFISSNYFVRYERFGNRMLRHYSTLRNFSRLNFNRPLKEHPFKLLVEENFIGTPSMVLVKREVIQQVGFFNTRYKVAEDLDYFLRASLVTNFILLSEPLSYKRTHGTNVTNDCVRFYEGHKEVLSQAIMSHQPTIDATDLSQVCALALAKNNYQLGNVYYEQGQKGKAFWHYLQALNYSTSWLSIEIFVMTFFKKIVRLLTFDRFTARFKDRLQQI